MKTINNMSWRELTEYWHGRFKRAKEQSGIWRFLYKQALFDGNMELMRAERKIKEWQKSSDNWSDEWEYQYYKTITWQTIAAIFLLSFIIMCRIAIG